MDHFVAGARYDWLGEDGVNADWLLGAINKSGAGGPRHKFSSG